MRLGLLLVASCSWSTHSHGRTECPPGASELRVGDVQYCLISCHGAIEDGVNYMATERIATFDDGIVVAVHSGEGGGYTRTPKDLPDAVCHWLPHGCRCTTPACKFFERRSVAIREERPPPLPRCEASDPDCGPEAFRHSCVAEVGYQPGVSRRPFSGPAPEQPCSFDGECVDSGCGYQCLSTRSLEATYFTCIGIPSEDARLDRALCGCVEGSCRWFEVARR